MSDLRERVASTGLVRRGDRVLAGVSGGADSVALLHALAALREQLGFWLGAVHVDHRLRPDSGDDACFVEEVGRRLHVPVTVLQRDVFAERPRGVSLEDAARRVRYDAFRTAAQRHSTNRLALAHTADDQAETVLMRLLRGAGLTGLTGIPPARPIAPPARRDTSSPAGTSSAARIVPPRSVTEELLVVRPLLGVWRDELLAYLAAEGLSYRQDPSNHDPQFLRNRLRHQLVPLLEREYNPNIKALLVQLAEQCRTDAVYLQAEVQRYWKRLVKLRDGALAVDLIRLRKQPPALQRQLMRRAIQQVQGDLAGFEFRHWIEIERLVAERPPGTILDLPNGVQLQRMRDRVLVRLAVVEQLASSSDSRYTT